MLNTPSPFRDVALSLQKGLRDTLRPGLAFFSLMIGGLAAVLMSVIFWIFWADIQKGAAWLAALSMGWMFDSPHPLLLAALRWLLSLALFFMGMLLLVQLALELWLMSRIQRTCLARYPGLSPSPGADRFSLGLGDTLRTAATWFLGSMVCLLIPFFGGFLLVGLSCYLGVRGLVNDALDGLAAEDEIRHLISQSRPQMLLLGLAVGLFTLLPMAGLLAPVLAGASTCHLFMGRFQALKAVHPAHA
jgi:hypothetical protein